MAWKKGPLPPDTWNWGGVVPVGSNQQHGFYFADFCGDSVKIFPGDTVLQAHEVALYDNGIDLPPNCQGRQSIPLAKEGS